MKFTQKSSADRTSTTVWLHDSEYPELNWISKKLDRISGLQVSNIEGEPMASEGYQVKYSWNVE